MFHLHCCKRSSVLPGQSQIPAKWKKKKCCFLRVRGETAGARVPQTQPICPSRKAWELPGLLLDVPRATLSGEQSPLCPPWQSLPDGGTDAQVAQGGCDAYR